MTIEMIELECEPEELCLKENVIFTDSRHAATEIINMEPVAEITIYRKGLIQYDDCRKTAKTCQHS
jgi:hypothetical protein